VPEEDGRCVTSLVGWVFRGQVGHTQTAEGLDYMWLPAVESRVLENSDSMLEIIGQRG